MADRLLARHRAATLSAREDSRVLEGVAVQYGDIARNAAPHGRERISPGAFAGNMGDVTMTVQHDRSKLIARTGAGLKLTDGPDALRFRADLPDTQLANDVLAMVRAGVYTDASITFHVASERIIGGVAHVDRGVLSQVSIVDRGAYPSAKVRAREAAEAARERREILPWWL